ncbi:MAG: hypothetical protein PVI99_04440 [Anaerolineales bacterium]|jgi:hypothetical protein
MSEQTKPCAAVEARQFDFWLGNWDLTWGEDERGSNSITTRYDGCVIEEKFNGAPSMDFRGMSVSTYNPTIEKWQQTWVDSQGSYIHLTGVFKDGKMVLVNHPPESDGSLLFRMVFYNIKDDSLDWDWERSEDGGQSWELRWRIHYERAKDG